MRVLYVLMCQPGECESDGDAIADDEPKANDRGIDRHRGSQYNASAAGTLLLHNAIATMLCISSNLFWIASGCHCLLP